MTNLQALTDRMAKSASGWGAVINGVLDIRTVTETRNGTALNALYVMGIGIISNCQDRDCDCVVKALNKLKPEVQLVAVRVEVTA